MRREGSARSPLRGYNVGVVYSHGARRGLASVALPGLVSGMAVPRTDPNRLARPGNNYWATRLTRVGGAAIMWAPQTARHEEQFRAA